MTLQVKCRVDWFAMYSEAGPITRVSLMSSSAARAETIKPFSGSVKLTSADGPVMVMKAGKIATLPKEWIGHFDTPGYTQLYATCNSDDTRK